MLESRLKGVCLSEPLSQSILWRIGGPWGVQAAAKRLCGEIGMQPASEKVLRDQITNSLVRFAGWQPAPGGRKRLIEIRLDVTVGRLRLVDRLLWDPSEPQNDADDFAQSLAGDLGLSQQFAAAIAKSIAEQRDAAWAAVLRELDERKAAGLSLDAPTAVEWVESADKPEDCWSDPKLTWV